MGNPDKIVAVGLGEVLYDHDVVTDEYTFGGAPANFADHFLKCSRLISGPDAAEVHVVSAVGDDERGRAMSAELEARELCDGFCRVGERDFVTAKRSRGQSPVTPVGQQPARRSRCSASARRHADIWSRRKRNFRNATPLSGWAITETRRQPHLRSLSGVARLVSPGCLRRGDLRAAGSGRTGVALKANGWVYRDAVTARHSATSAAAARPSDQPGMTMNTRRRVELDFVPEALHLHI